MRRILVVDDDDNFRETLVDALRFEGYTVDSASNGEEALRILRADPDHRWLAVLDMMMPVMDGETFLAMRNEDPLLSAVAVIVMTAGGDCRELLATHDIEACLHKTVSLPKLTAAIDACD